MTDAEIAALLARARATTESNTFAHGRGRDRNPVWLVAMRAGTALIPLFVVIAIATVVSSVF